MQIKKNPRDLQPGESREGYEEDGESGLNAIPEFRDEPQRPAWRREPAFAAAVEKRPPPVAADAPGMTASTPSPIQAPPRGESVVDGHSTFDGRYETDQDLRLLGNMSGEVICRGLLTIERDATAKARITAHDVIARGGIEGEITCTGRLVIESGAKVTGKVRASVLVVQEGAVLSGDVDTAVEAPTPAAGARNVRREAASGSEDGLVSAPMETRERRSRDLPSFALVSSEQRVAGERSPAPAR